MSRFPPCLKRKAAIRPCPTCASEVPLDAPACPQCGHAFESREATSPFKPGTVLESRYRIDLEVGRGGMGVVYRGTDLTLKRPVAIKALRASDADATVLSRFLREARSLARVEHHGLVPVYAVGREEGVYYMVMKFVEGRTLQTVLQQEAPLDAPRTRKYLLEICDALGALHKAGLIHRDLKPGNLIVNPDDRLTVMDLGIVKAVGENTQTTSTALGTPKYMAPEMLDAHDVDGRADLYSLGVIAYEMLTGEPPFDGPTPMAILFKQAHEAPEPIRKRAPGVPRDLAAIVDRLLAKNRDQRFPDAEVLATALRGGGVEGPHGKRPGWLVPGLVAGAVAVGAVIYIGLSGGADPGPVKPAPPSTAAVTAPPPPPTSPPTAPPTAPPTEPASTAPPTAAPTQAASAAPPSAAAVKTVAITLTSDPTGAQILEGGRPIGRTPMTFRRPQAARAATFVLRRDGFAETRVNVNLAADAAAHARLESMFELVP